MASNTSAVWNFFLKESSEIALCLLCTQIYSRKGRGTTNLINHLKSMHKEEYAEMLEVERKSAEKKDLVKTLQKVLGERKSPEKKNSVKTFQKVKPDNGQMRVEEYITSQIL